MRTRNTSLTPEQRRAHADEWIWWRKRNPAGARRAWVDLKNWRHNRRLDMQSTIESFTKS